ncbi:hypothetical protein [Halobaculum marinum]|uniref:Small CPxCG-related zinc finger protein n=1 Tax=Halobaculum marinum TaxID=3031996 RepID=A0ABD5WXB9_9EURY|nr:hypothetical protein [Halobaculum sp. DT55]
MEYAFECACGEEVSDFTRGGDVEVNTVAVCDDCGAAYGLTISSLQRSDE